MNRQAVICLRRLIQVVARTLLPTQIRVETRRNCLRWHYLYRELICTCFISIMCSILLFGRRYLHDLIAIFILFINRFEMIITRSIGISVPYEIVFYFEICHHFAPIGGR